MLGTMGFFFSLREHNIKDDTVRQETLIANIMSKISKMMVYVWVAISSKNNVLMKLLNALHPWQFITELKSPVDLTDGMGRDTSDGCTEQGNVSRGNCGGTFQAS